MTSPTSRRAAAPLWAALAFTFLGSLGTGIVTTGVFYITAQRYAFTKTDNYLLGLVIGVTYIIGALAVGPALRTLTARSAAISSRLALSLIMTLLGALCALPIATLPDDAAPPAWPIWTFIALYTPLTGALWPLVESYLSGGRTGAPLRSAIGRFNITWASALVVGYLALGGPVIERYAAEAIALLGLVHIASIALLIPLGAEPGRHIHEHLEPHPASYRQLLITCRILLPTSYLVFTALNPYLPTALDRLGLAASLHTPIAATWLAFRTATFLVLERWHGWHGRWFLPLGGVGLMLGGFALSVLSPAFGDLLGARPGIALLIAGLAAFGVGIAAIYAAALYYAMEVGAAEVEAGGAHEALIGVGYTAGPLCGLAAVALTTHGPIDTQWFAPVMLTLTSAAAVAAALYALWRSWRLASQA